MPGTAIVRVTILVATVAWAWAEVMKMQRPRMVEPTRLLWTIGVALAVIHALAAFDVAHHWSHEAASTDTARRTAATIGVAWGGGIFVNYLFLALWIGDALWWWIAPDAYVRRPVTLERVRLVFFLFMFVNGAIIFAGSTARAVGVPAIASVCIAWGLQARGRAARA